MTPVRLNTVRPRRHAGRPSTSAIRLGTKDVTAVASISEVSVPATTVTDDGRSANAGFGSTMWE